MAHDDDDDDRMCKHSNDPPRLPTSCLPAGLAAKTLDCCWQVGRLYGFQAFNEASEVYGSVEVPDKHASTHKAATIFLAGDQLLAALNARFARLMELQSASLDDENALVHLRFHQAVLQLHATIFDSYIRKWSKVVSLPPLPAALRDIHTSPDRWRATHCLLAELALYFLLWTEAANLRHMSETVWFLYWVMLHAPAMTAFCQACTDEPVQSPLMSNAWRVRARAAAAAIIASARTDLGLGLPAVWVAAGNEPNEAAQRLSQSTAAPVAVEVIPHAASHKALQGGNTNAYETATQHLRDHIYQQCHAWAEHDDRAAGLMAHLHELNDPGSARQMETCTALGLLTKSPYLEHSSYIKASLPSYATPQSTVYRQCMLDYLVDVALYGDGGFVTERLVTPLTMLMASEMQDAQGAEDPCHRLGYDDVNESFCHYGIVHGLLKKLGMHLPDDQEVNKDAAHTAYRVLTVIISSTLATASTKISGGASKQDNKGGIEVQEDENEQGCPYFTGALRPCHELQVPEAAALVLKSLATSHLIAPPMSTQHMAAFWSEEVVTKTFVETRSWLMVFKVFRPVWALNFLGLQAMVLLAFFGWDARVFSTLVPVHAAFVLLGQAADAWTTNRPHLSVKQLEALGKKRHMQRYDLQHAKLKRLTEPVPRVMLHGSRWWDVLFFALLTAALSVGTYLYLHGTYPSSLPQAYVQQIQALWQLVLAAYGGAVLLGHIATWNDWSEMVSSWEPWRGFQRLLGKRVWLWRNQHTCHVSGSVRMNLATTLGQLAAWSAIYALKLTFEYFIICRPMIKPVYALLDLCWPCAGNSNISLSWLLVVLRLLPSFVVCQVDGMLCYHTLLSLWAILCGARRAGVDLRQEFHNAPARWWAKCVSSSSTGQQQDASPGGHSKAEQASTEWRAFSLVWNSLVEDLRASDLLSDEEHAHLAVYDTGVASAWLAQFMGSKAAADAAAVDGQQNSSSADDNSADDNSAGVDDQAAASKLLADGSLLGTALLPAFVHAGIVGDLVESCGSNANGEQQLLALQQLRGVALALLAGLGVLMPAEVQALQTLGTGWAAARITPKHQLARQQLLADAKLLLDVLLAVFGAGNQTPGAATKQLAAKLHERLVKLVLQLQVTVETACQPAAAMPAAMHNLLHKQSLQSMQQHVKVLKDVHARVHGLPVDEVEQRMLQRMTWVPPSAATTTTLLQPPTPEAASTAQVQAATQPTMMMPAYQLTHCLWGMLRVTPAEARPRCDEALRVLETFLKSLGMPSMAKAPSMVTCPSMTTLTPLYNEDVLYALDAHKLAASSILPTAGNAATSSALMITPEQQTEVERAAEGLTDLLSEAASGPHNKDGSVSTITYLVSVYFKEWENFVERIGRMAGLPQSELAKVTPLDFRPDTGKLRAWALELQLWASYRGQLLARTVRGMECYHRALSLLAHMEHPVTMPAALATTPTAAPCPFTTVPTGPGVAGLSAQTEWHRQLVDSKFRHVVAAQLYGSQRKSNSLKDKWAAQGAELLLARHPAMQLAYIDSAGKNLPSYSVLVRGYAVEGGSRADRPKRVSSSGQLCGNDLLGSGKLVSTPPRAATPPRASSSGQLCGSELCSSSAKPPAVPRVGLPPRVSSSGQLHGSDVLGNGRLVVAARAAMSSPRVSSNGEAPAHSSSRLAAAARIEEVYRVKLPANSKGIIIGEGKPENQNHAIIFCLGECVQAIDMNQDNVLAEALKIRNVLQEIGLNDLDAKDPLLAGSKDFTADAAIKHIHDTSPQPVAMIGLREWIFSDRTNALGSFAASYEYAFSTVLQPRMAAAGVRLHYGHPDVVNKQYVMTRGGISKATKGLHVSEDVFAGLAHMGKGAANKMCVHSFVGKGRDMGLTSILGFESKISKGTAQVFLSRDLARLAPRLDLPRLLHFYHAGPGYFTNSLLTMLVVSLQVLCTAALAIGGVRRLWYNGELVPILYSAPLGFMTGLVANLPFVAQSLLDEGWLAAILQISRQLISGSMLFGTFRMHTTAITFCSGIMYGDAAYFSTGRGFANSSIPFAKLYAMYGRTHMQPAAGLMVMLALTGVLVASDGIAFYASITWPLWLYTVSLLLSASWFSPESFRWGVVKQDWIEWRKWIAGGSSVAQHDTWAHWNRTQLKQVRNWAGEERSQWGMVFVATAMALVPPLLLAGMAAIQLAGTWSLLFISLVAWGPAMAMLLINYINPGHRYVRKAWYLSWACVVAAFVFASVLSAVAHMYSSQAIVQMLVLHVCIGTALHRVCLHLLPPYEFAWLVNGGFWLQDVLVGGLLLCALTVLSCGAVVARIQMVLLFSTRYARSVRQGKLARSIAKFAKSGLDAVPVTVIENDEEEEETDGNDADSSSDTAVTTTSASSDVGSLDGYQQQQAAAASLGERALAFFRPASRSNTPGQAAAADLKHRRRHSQAAFSVHDAVIFPAATKQPAFPPTTHLDDVPAERMHTFQHWQSANGAQLAQNAPASTPRRSSNGGGMASSSMRLLLHSISGKAQQQEQEQQQATSSLVKTWSESGAAAAINNLNGSDLRPTPSYDPEAPPDVTATVNDSRRGTP